MLAWFCGLVLVSAALLGGGTHPGFLGDVAVQCLAAPLLVAASWRLLVSAESDRQMRRRLIFWGSAAIFIFVLQLLPLPFDFWSGGAFLTGGHPRQDFLPERTWAPLSVSPQASWAAVASFIVPAAIFLCAVQLSLRETLLLTWVLGGLGAAALALGFLQVAQGPASELRFYAVTNRSESVGFFANRNHFAAHLYVTLLIGSVWFARVAGQLRRTDTAFKTRSIFWVTAAAVFLISAIAGLAMARSRAGVFLSMIALGGIVVMMLLQNKRQADGGAHTGTKAPTGLISVITVVIAVLFAVQFGLGSILSRFEGGAFDELRIPFTQTTLETAIKALPLGTGLGSFPRVYATVEKDGDVFPAFVNRAHNDFAEFLLETGFAGAVLLGAFLVWFCTRAYRIWATPDSKANESQLLLQRAATLIVCLLLIHSLVDYPLRTTALSAIFAFFCACLAAEAAAPEEPSAQMRRRQTSDVRQSSPQLMENEKWGEDIQWPDSWQASNSRDPAAWLHRGNFTTSN